MRISIPGRWSNRRRKELRIAECGLRNVEIQKKIKEQGSEFKSEIPARFAARRARQDLAGGRNLKSEIRSGFTLLELSLVILVIGMILALVLPNLGIPKSKLEREREIEKISQTIKYLYDLSQIKNKEIYLLFDLNTNKFRAVSLLIEGHDENEDLLPEKRISSSFKIEDIIDSKGNKITEGITSLIFHPSGFVEPATIHFIDEKEKFYTLFINPLTGQSHFEPGYIEEE